MMAARTSTSKTSTVTMQDGAELFERTWPVDSPKASITIAHGYGEHCGRYEHIATRLNAEGFSVFAYDQRAHGKSPGTMGYIPSFDQLESDFEAYNAIVAERIGHHPEFMMGHSMGALLCALHVERRQPEIKGLVLSSGGFKVGDDVSPMVQRLSAVLSVLAPKMAVHHVDPAGLSHDPAEVKAYETDPLVYHGKIQARTGHVMMQAIQEVLASAGKITPPVIMLHGIDDPIVEAVGTEELFSLIASEDKTLRLYEGAFHEVFNDDKKDEFLQDLADWLNAHA